MKGSKIAYEIESDWRREEYFKKKATRNQCIIDNKKQCHECKYKDICIEKD